MKYLVFTAVFNDFDRVFPPVKVEDGISYYLLTDDAAVRVDGWHTMYVDISNFRDAKSANHYYRSMIHEEVPGYDASIYVDGNIRILGNLRQLFEAFLATNAGLGVYRHPLRSTVADEAHACLVSGKISAIDMLQQELQSQKDDGFKDDIGLIEATIMMKNHHDQRMRLAMQLWQDRFESFGTRNQLSLPYVIWKTGVTCLYQDHNFREKNRYFGLYPHMKAHNVNPHYVVTAARAYDSLIYNGLLHLWRFQWAVQRWLRSRMAPVDK